MNRFSALTRFRPTGPTLGTVAGVAVLAGVVTATIVWPGADATPSSKPTHVTHYSTTGRYAEGTALVSGRLITPVGRQTTLNDFSVGLALSPDKKVAVVANSGQGQGDPQQQNESLQLVDVATGKVIQRVTDHEKDVPTFYESGVVWSRDGKHVYATGGGNNEVYDYAYSGGRLKLAHRFLTSVLAGAPTIPGTRFNGVPASAPVLGDIVYSRGLSILPNGKAIIVANEQGSTVAALSTTDGSLLWETRIGGPSTPAGPSVSAYPEAVLVAPNGRTAYVAAQGLNQVVALDTTTGLVTSTTTAGDHPVAMAFGEHGKQLYVVSANDDAVMALDLTQAVPVHLHQTSVHLYQGEANGSTPVAVTVDDRTHTVYVANAGDNVIQVLRSENVSDRIDAHHLRVVGSIPTGWYPTSVTVAPHNKLLVLSAKGLGGAPITSHEQYIVNKRHGLLTTVSLPGAAQFKKQMRTWSATSLHNLKYPSEANRLRPKDSPIPTWKNRGDSPIKHVVLVVRENRTFDQVFGDLKRKGANVEPDYVQFGYHDEQGLTITPNIHRIANQYALSQNFYSDGEASIQGHDWTTSGVSTDYTERAYLHYYSDRNHPNDPGSAIIYPRCATIFQQLTRQGKTFTNYGELIGLNTIQPPTAHAAPDVRCATPGSTFDAGSLANFDPNMGANATLTSVNDIAKVNEITSTLSPKMAAGAMPQFTYAVLGNDHTDGTDPGSLTPQALVARNDLAIGKLVDFLSHSADWKSTAVFILEDDSQDGLDHVDGHRNILTIASPYAAHHELSSLHISQASVLHTIELILGIDPLSSYTQNAPVPYDMFQSKPDLTPYNAIKPTYPRDMKNPAAKAGSASAVPLNLSTIDVAGPMLEAQIWEATRPGEPMPPALIAEVKAAGGIQPLALDAWARGLRCACKPLAPGLKTAPGGFDYDG